MAEMYRYYEILGLQPGASLEQVKEAYKDLVKVWHTDRFAHDARLQQKAQAKLKDINEAFERLQSFQIGMEVGGSQVGSPRLPNRNRRSSSLHGGRGITEASVMPSKALRRVAAFLSVRVSTVKA
jgi:curved DNA-binding protein CbpA